MRKGDGSGLMMIISVIVLMIILVQYFIFSMIFPHKSVQSDLYFGSGIDFDLINFVELNSDLIVKSVKNDNYDDLSIKMKKMDFNGRCWQLKINDEVFNIYICSMNEHEAAETSIPDYSNNDIKIILRVNKK